MEEWESKWRRNKAKEKTLRANQQAGESEKKSAFPEKQDIILTKLENFVLRWNSNDAKGLPSKQIRFEKVQPHLCRVATITTRSVSIGDGPPLDTLLELDVDFDNLNTVIKSSLHPAWHNESLGEEVILSLAVTPSGSTHFCGSSGPKIDNGHIVGEILAPLLPYL
jgi:hypothetical protein